MKLPPVSPSIKRPELGYMRACPLSIIGLKKSANGLNAVGLSFSKADYYIYQLQPWLPTHLQAIINPHPCTSIHKDNQERVPNRQNAAVGSYLPICGPDSPFPECGSWIGLSNKWP